MHTPSPENNPQLDAIEVKHRTSHIKHRIDYPFPKPHADPVDPLHMCSSPCLILFPFR